ncbi:hypothetical protein EJB05_49149 [Eragrostis curvula]|uniref:Uncharacterized protein n=1 Tax=Eragrostis curvula TaxID=38414 RepID=A0A5J9T3J6_9POAL|nr:hypothetical protein EJB05_49144 [Eragrostis curvula]TVU05963.1 hypothetical protein EJB05_49149 [Eragrostis curvula]
MLREARVPMLPTAAATARPRRRRLLKAVSAFLRLVENAVLYGFLAALWANSVGGTFVEILGRWVCGKGSSVEAAGKAVAAWCMFLVARLLPVCIPLVMMRVGKRAKFDLAMEAKERREEEEEREKAMPASKHIISVASANDQLPERNRAQLRLPKGFNLTSLYACVPLFKLLYLGTVMQLRHEEGSFMWRVGYALFDVAHLGIAIIVAFWGVRNLVILVTVPRTEDGDDVML